jgi:hypothetical protein
MATSPQAAWLAATTAKGMTATKLATTMALSGWYLYTYNEFAFKVEAPCAMPPD